MSSKRKFVYEIYDKKDITRKLLKTIKKDDYIKVNTWKRPFKVVAVSKNFFIMTKPFFNSYQYSICEKTKRGYAHNMCYRPKNGFDADEFICGPDNYWCKYDYTDQKELKKALKDLEKGKMEVSQRLG